MARIFAPPALLTQSLSHVTYTLGSSDALTAKRPGSFSSGPTMAARMAYQPKLRQEPHARSTNRAGI
jgi:hypothetical protein